MPIKMTIHGVEVTVDNPSEAAEMLKMMNAIPEPPMPVKEPVKPTPIKIVDPPAPVKIVEPVKPTPKQELINHNFKTPAKPDKRSNPSPDIDRETVLEIRKQFAEGSTPGKIAGDFELPYATVYKICMNKTYKADIYQKKTQQPVTEVPKPEPAPAKDQQEAIKQEIFELLATGENPNEVMKAYNLSRRSTMILWNAYYQTFCRANLNNPQAMNKLSQIHNAMIVWGQQVG